MGYPNDQSQIGAAIYVWDVTSLLAGQGGVPVPDSQGRFPTYQNNMNAAIPVYAVTGTPTDTPPFPNDQGAIENNPPQGALPVIKTVQPTANADGTFPSDPTNPNSAIPVYFVASPIAIQGTYPNAQNNVGGAIPVWIA